ncbi:DUF1993 family protein [Nevskia sp.]|uniref:DUF1993 domain-containing protein n=1 Tax=Nevskia sp. TaxID=1929292 RepID=UPI0025DE2FDA|nr:DUF1993 domain-containing protein [Nevskia sp.]
MTISMYQASIPVFLRALDNLAAIMDVGAAHAEAKKIDPLVLTGTRMYPDMFPMSRQVQIACDMVKGGAARLAGIEPPPRGDTEKTFAELKERIEWTAAFVRSVTAEQVDGSEDRAIVLKTPFGDLNFTGQQYLLGFVLPNLYFHSATAYNLLRHSGVELGKRDFLGRA